MKSIHATDRKALYPSFSLLTLILDTILASLAVSFPSPQQIRSSKLEASAGCRHRRQEQKVTADYTGKQEKLWKTNMTQKHSNTGPAGKGHYMSEEPPEGKFLITTP